MIPAPNWTWPGRMVRVVDGDTIDVTLDVGFHATRTERLRLLGVNTPEVVGATKAAGLAAKAWVEAWFTTVGLAIVVETHKSDVFGRYLARVYSPFSGVCLNDDLLTAGQAVVYAPN